MKKKTKRRTKACDEYHKNNPDVKELMATLLMQHNLLPRRDWSAFHKDIDKIVRKYYPIYQKGMAKWWKGKICINI